MASLQRKLRLLPLLRLNLHQLNLHLLHLLQSLRRKVKLLLQVRSQLLRQQLPQRKVLKVLRLALLARRRLHLLPRPLPRKVLLQQLRNLHKRQQHLPNLHPPNQPKLLSKSSHLPTQLQRMLKLLLR
jgi:hypothetical protein